MHKIINYSIVSVFGIVFLIPLLWVIMTSFTDPSQLITGNSIVSFKNLTISNYINAWNDAPFIQYYINTLFIVIGILIVQLFTITLAAYAFARLEFFGKSVIFILFLTQIMIPAEILIFPNYTIMKTFGLIDSKLAIMLPYFASAFGVFLLRQTFKQVPIDLEEAAKVDGCNWWRILWNVYVPAAKPTYIAFGLITVAHHWSNFMWPLIISNTVESRPLTVGIAIFAKSFETGAQWGTVTAATIMVILPLLLAFLIFSKQFMDSFMHSGIK